MKNFRVFIGLCVGLFLSNSTLVFADGNWANVAVTIKANNSVDSNYLLYNGGYNVNVNLSNATVLDGYDFGTVTSLILDGGIGAGWADNGDYYNDQSFIIYYRAYSTSGTAGGWSSVALGSNTYQSGNNYEYSTNTPAGVNVLSLVGNLPGTYYLEVVMSKNQFYTGNSWLSMVPGGQSVAYNISNTGYKATFTIAGTATSNVKVLNNFKMRLMGRTLVVDFSGSAAIQLYSISGQLIDKKIANGNYNKLLEEGTYILNVEGKSYKIIVP